MSISDLGVFVGEWAIEARFPSGPESEPSSGTTTEPPDKAAAPAGRSRFEWILDRQYLAQRIEVPVPEAPDGFTVVAANPGEDTYTQHYYDSRGVTRLYAMTFSGGVWTLLRESADFSPLDFAQRFTGRFSADGDRIEGRWEKKLPDSDWELDFELSYQRLKNQRPKK